MKRLSTTSVYSLILLLSVSNLFSQTPDWTVDQSHSLWNLNANVRMLSDAFGNIYTVNNYAFFGNNVVILKYDASGNLLNQFYVDSMTVCSDLAIDNSGNFYVLGYYLYTQEVALEKLNSSGTRQWVWKYGSVTPNTKGYMLKLDNTANAYIGGSVQTNSNYDVLTVKINSSGVQQWLKTYDYNGSNDEGYAVAVDNSGNVYTTGSGFKTNQGNNIIIVKYNSSGVQQWAKDYNGSGNDNDAGNDVIASANGVYLTGTAYITGSGNNFTTIKYNSSGTQQWANNYVSGTLGSATGKRIFLDVSSNVYVAGQSAESLHANSLDLTAIKYNNAGTQQWAFHYDNGKNNHDNLLNAWFDASSNLFLAGYAIDTSVSLPFNYDEELVKINSSGAKQFAKFYGEGTTTNEFPYGGVILDGSGNIYTSGESDDGNIHYAYITKRNATGALQWNKNYTAPRVIADNHADMAVDNKGNSFAVGTTYTIGGNVQITLDKRDKNGNLVFTSNYTGTINTGPIQRAVRVLLDAKGNIFVCAVADSLTNNGFTWDYLLMKFNSSGNLVWHKYYDVSNGGSDVVSDMTIDASSNVYLCGNGYSNTTSFDIYVLKADSNGNKLWSKTYNGAANSSDNANAIAVDNSGNVFVTGYSSEVNFFTIVFCTIKYNSGGTQQWTTKGTYDNYTNMGNDIIPSGDGGCYVTGFLYNGTNSSSFATLKYNSNGTIAWTKFRQNTNNSTTVDVGVNIVLDGNGNVYSQGFVHTASSYTSLSIYKYNATGDTVWTYEREGSNYYNTNYGYDRQFLPDALGNFYAANLALNTTNVEIIKLNKNGKKQWIYTNNVPTVNVLYQNSPYPVLAADGIGAIWACIDVFPEFTGPDWRTLKFCGGPTPTISANGPTTFCQGNSVQLTANGNNASDYFWSNSKTTKKITVSASGNYSVIITYTNGCTVSSQNTTVTVNPLPGTTITPAGPVNLCPGTSVSLTANGNGNVLWNTDATTSTISVSTAATYKAVRTTNNGCKDSASVIVNGIPCATPTNPTASNITATSAKLKWDSVACHIKYNAQYRVQGTNTWTKKNATTNSISISGLSASTTYEWQVRTQCASGPNVYSPYTAIKTFMTPPVKAEGTNSASFIADAFPNPVSQFLEVRLSGLESGDLTVKLMNALGQIVFIAHSTVDGENYQLEIPVQEMAAGVYSLKIENATHQSNQIILKQ